MTVNRNIGPDAPIVENENGARQSKLEYRFDLIDPHAAFILANILHTGAEKYGDTNWHNISVRDHLNHALVYIYAHLDNDTTDEHLAHAFTRLMFALSDKTSNGNIIQNSSLEEAKIKVESQNLSTALGTLGSIQNPTLIMSDGSKHELTSLGWVKIK